MSRRGWSGGGWRCAGTPACRREREGRSPSWAGMRVLEVELANGNLLLVGVLANAASWCAVVQWGGNTGANPAAKWRVLWLFAVFLGCCVCGTAGNPPAQVFVLFC